MMKSVPDRSKQYGVYCLAMIVLGVLIMVGHNTVLNLVCKAICVLMLLSAAGGIDHYRKTSSDNRSRTAQLAGVLVFVVIGILCLWKQICSSPF